MQVRATLQEHSHETSGDPDTMPATILCSSADSSNPTDARPRAAKPRASSVRKAGLDSYKPSARNQSNSNDAPQPLTHPPEARACSLPSSPTRTNEPRNLPSLARSTRNTKPACCLSHNKREQKDSKNRQHQSPDPTLELSKCLAAEPSQQQLEPTSSPSPIARALRSPPPPSFPPPPPLTNPARALSSEREREQSKTQQ